MSTQAAPAMYCSQCGKSFAASEITQLAGMTVCAGCKPQLLRRMQETGSATVAPVRYKGFWIRLVAKIVDALIFIIPFMILAIIAMPRLIASRPRGVTAGPSSILAASTLILFEFLIVGLTVIYNAAMVQKYGATLGKMAIGALVVPESGGSMSWGRSFGRAFAELLSGFTLDIGYIIAAFHPKKRALHDLIAGTVVIANNR